MISFGLDWNDWDLQLDSNGNIVVYDGDEQIAQSCANAIRLFTKEAYFDLDRGIPHFDINLGQSPLPSKIVTQTRIKKACMAVVGVVSCEVILTFDEETRTLGGEVNVGTVNGATIKLKI